MKKMRRRVNPGGSTYSVRELSLDIGMCERSLRDAIRRGDVPHIKIGKRYILPRAAIALWLQNAGGEAPPMRPVAAELR